MADDLTGAADFRDLVEFVDQNRDRLPMETPLRVAMRAEIPGRWALMDVQKVGFVLSTTPRYDKVVVVADKLAGWLPDQFKEPLGLEE
jgi:hypothetical protein